MTRYFLINMVIIKILKCLKAENDWYQDLENVFELVTNTVYAISDENNN